MPLFWRCVYAFVTVFAAHTFTFECFHTHTFCSSCPFYLWHLLNIFFLPSSAKVSTWVKKDRFELRCHRAMDTIKIKENVFRLTVGNGIWLCLTNFWDVHCLWLLIKSHMDMSFGAWFFSYTSLRCECVFFLAFAIFGLCFFDIGFFWPFPVPLFPCSMFERFWWTVSCVNMTKSREDKVAENCSLWDLSLRLMMRVQLKSNLISFAADQTFFYQCLAGLTVTVETTWHADRCDSFSKALFPVFESLMPWSKLTIHFFPLNLIVFLIDHKGSIWNLMNWLQPFLACIFFRLRTNFIYSNSFVTKGGMLLLQVQTRVVLVHWTPEHGVHCTVYFTHSEFNLFWGCILNQLFLISHKSIFVC